MHELSVMKNILEIALEHGKQAGAQKIDKINLEVGAFTEFVPRWAQLYFAMISQNTIAEKAEIHVEQLPGVIKCRLCGSDTEVDSKRLRMICNNCQSNQVEIVAGREFRIDSIEIE